MPAELKSFVQQIIRVAAPTADIGGAVIPSLSGTVNAGADTVQGLHLKTMEFAQAYKDPKTSQADVERKAKAVEGALMAAVTLGVLPGREGGRLIDALQTLVEQRQDQ